MAMERGMMRDEEIGGGIKEIYCVRDDQLNGANNHLAPNRGRYQKNGQIFNEE